MDHFLPIRNYFEQGLQFIFLANMTAKNLKAVNNVTHI